jgi:hypothetical protein
VVLYDVDQDVAVLILVFHVVVVDFEVLHVVVVD